MKAEHPARVRLASMKKMLPTIWDHVADERQHWCPGIARWPIHIFIPIERALDVTIRAHQDIGWDITNDFQRQRVCSLVQGLSAWRMTQGIYRFDATLYEELINTPITGDVPVEILRHLPEWCVYIETPGLESNQGRKFIGIWYWLGHVEREEAIFCGFDTGGNVVKVISVTLSRLNLEEALAQSPDLAVELPLSLVSGVFSLILFLCTHAGEISGAKRPGNPALQKTRRGMKTFPAREPTVWNVGTRLGAALRAAYARIGSADAGESGRSVRPHIRRAHWHTFLSGPREGERHRDVRWLPPIPVKVEDYDGLPSVIRRVG